MNKLMIKWTRGYFRQNFIRKILCWIMFTGALEVKLREEREPLDKEYAYEPAFVHFALHWTIRLLVMKQQINSFLHVLMVPESLFVDFLTLMKLMNSQWILMNGLRNLLYFRLPTVKEQGKSSHTRRESSNSRAEWVSLLVKWIYFDQSN